MDHNHLSVPKTRLALLALLAVLTEAAWGAPYGPGNLAVLRLGDGTQPLANSGNSVFVDQYTPSGGLVSTVSVPDHGADALIGSGTAGSEGGLSRSADRAMLTFAGYCTNRGSVGVSLSSQTGATVPRGIAVIDAFGTYFLAQASTTLYSGNNIRGGVTDGTNHYWSAGTPNGTYYLAPPAAPVNVQTNAGANTLYAKIINGTLWFSTQKGAIGIYGFAGGGLPMAPAATNLLIATGSSSQPAGFDINPEQTVVYVADARPSAGGIQKWTNSGSAWVLAYTLSTGAGAFAVAADFSGATPIVYATTGESFTNRLVRFVDTNATAIAALVAQAGANQCFKGLDFAPDLRPLWQLQPESLVATNGDTPTFVVAATSPYALQYQWQLNGTNLAGRTQASLTLTNIRTADQGLYQAVAANQYYSVTSAPARLTVITQILPPAIGVGPQSQTNLLGGSATFAVTATGTALNYQWLFNGAYLSGQSATNLVLNNLSAARQGSYQVVVANSDGSITSAPAQLTVLVPPTSFVPYHTPGQVYVQDFNSLPNPGGASVNADNPATIGADTFGVANPFDFTYPILANGVDPVSGIGLGGLGLGNTMPGWYGWAALAPKIGASEGDQSTGGIISFGSTNSGSTANRALGLVATSSTGGTAFALKLVNQTGDTLGRLSVQVTGELWRQAAVPKALAAAYSIDPAATNAFSAMGLTALTNLNVAFPTNAAAASPIPVDGTLPANQITLAINNYPIADWPTGAALWLVWQMTDPAGKGQGLAIDNLSLSADLWSVGVSAPQLRAFALGNNLVLSCPTVPGRHYQFESATNLVGATWLPVGAAILGTGDPLAVTNLVGSLPQSYFRVSIQP